MRLVEGIKQFQLVQEKTDRFVVRIVKGRGFTNTVSEEVEQALKQTVGDMEINVVVVDSILKSKVGHSYAKTRQFFKGSSD